MLGGTKSPRLPQDSYSPCTGRACKDRPDPRKTDSASPEVLVTQAAKAIERIPPQNLEAEKSLLGAMMLSNPPGTAMACLK